MQRIHSTVSSLRLALLALMIFAAGCTAPSNLPMPENLKTQAKAPEVVSAAPKVASAAPKAAQMADTKKVNPSAANALTPDQSKLLASLPSKGAAPELNNRVWLNTKPLKLAELRGKVVMVEFWTFACINCQHVLPSLKALHAKYADKGLVIIGVHSPEFGYEKELNNVKAAIAEAGIEYPVAIDNDYATWNAYQNHFWPARYMIDKTGNLRLLQIGEGGYAQTEAVVQALLAEPNPS
jgi:thiol-disulfide isomerase/thioredoxin